jgi:Zn-dependent peptidase ImmA (M78 family)
VATTRAHVTPEVLRWARQSLGVPLEDAAERIGVPPETLEGAESGDLLLTLRQAERAAKLYQRPLAALYLSEPPTEEPQEAQFRRLPGAPPPPWPPEMQALVRRVRDRQDAAAELYETLDETSPWIEAREELRAAGRPLPELARELLGVSREEQFSWRDQAGYTPLRHWTDAVEGLGVLVMQDGALPVEAMRGFAAVHPQVPAIVVNTQDDARARAFTAIHELGHHYLAAFGEEVGPETESWCDAFAGEVLMPLGWVQDALANTYLNEPVEVIDELALTFGVTPLAAAVRVARAGIWSQGQIDGVIDEIHRRPPRGGGKGGDYYRNEIAKMGPSFVRLVFTALEGQVVTYPVASTLLDGVKVSNFDTLREYVERRAQLP